MRKILLFILLFPSACCFTLFAQPCREPGSLIAVRTNRLKGHDYVIFQFKKETASSSWMPEFSWVKPPFRSSPDDAPLSVKGCRFLRIHFRGVIWTCTINQSGMRKRWLIQDIKKSEQFEGDIEYIIGLKCASKKYKTYDYSNQSFYYRIIRF